MLNAFRHHGDERAGFPGRARLAEAVLNACRGTTGTNAAAMIRSISMNALEAHVENGRIVVDEPTDLPDGTELHVVPVNDGDDIELQIDAAWREEIRRRSARLHAGEAKTTPWEIARREVFGR